MNLRPEALRNTQAHARVPLNQKSNENKSFPFPTTMGPVKLLQS
jgi:hypothetical protein